MFGINVIAKDFLSLRVRIQGIFLPFSFLFMLFESCFSVSFHNLFHFALVLFLWDSLKIAQIPSFAPFRKALHDVVFCFKNIYLSEDLINEKKWATNSEGLVREKSERSKKRIRPTCCCLFKVYRSFLFIWSFLFFVCWCFFFRI